MQLQALIEAASIEEAAPPGEFKIGDIFHLIAGVRGRQVLNVPRNPTAWFDSL